MNILSRENDFKKIKPVSSFSRLLRELNTFIKTEYATEISNQKTYCSMTTITLKLLISVYQISIKKMKLSRQPVVVLVMQLQK